MENQKSISELKTDAEKLREEIARLRFDLSLNKLKDTNMIKKKRRDLARILTRIRQLEIIDGDKNV
jgi:ribosomal protein L29